MAINPLQAPINYASQMVDLTPAFAGLGQAVAQRRERTQEQARQEEAAAIKAQYATDLQATLANPTQSSFNKLILTYPQQRQALESARQSFGEERVKNEFNQGFSVSMALENNNPTVAMEELKTIIAAKKNAGEPTQIYDQVFAALESGNTKAAQAGVNMALSTMDPERFEKTVKAQVAAAEAPSKLSQQVAAASKAVTDAEVAVATAPDDIAKAKAQRELSQAQVRSAAVDEKYKERTLTLNIRKIQKEIASEGSNDGVQSSKITPDGTSIIVTKSGTTRVIGADGVELTGQDRVDAVRKSEEFGAGIQGLRSGSRKAGEIGQVEAQKAFVTLGKIATNISNLDSAVAALDAGATTGVIASKFPNWKASTIELQNIQRNLGLDIIGSVTFGALSEGELSLALETALPLNMDEAQLKDWLTRKKNAQVKLSDYITEQARFLSVPGQTIGQWLQQSEKSGGRPGGMTAPGTGSNRNVTVDY
jgi:hypothetical protein